MITQIIAKDLKGLSFIQDLGSHTLFLGPNGSGKSARSQALILALLGYIPGGGKQNADILDSYGSSDKLVVGVKIDDQLFERGFVRKDNKVSQGFKVNGKGVRETEFSKALGMAGAPVAIDINAFMALSDAKKIDVFMDLYPPESDLSKIVMDIEEKKAKINSLTARAKELEGAAARLTTARANMQLPIGTLADVQAQIKETEDKLAKARQDLKDSEIEEAKIKAAAEEKEKAAKQAELNLQKQEQAPPAAITPVQAIVEPVSTRPSLNDKEFFSMESPMGKTVTEIMETRATASIQAILDALNKSGCAACTARLVAMRELKKYRKEAAA